MLKKISFLKILTKKLTKRIQILLLAWILFLSTSYLAYNLYFFKKIFPSVYISGVLISGKTENQAVQELSNKITTPEKLILNANSKSFEIDLETYGFSYNLEESIKTAYKIGRRGHFFKDFLTRVSLPFKKSTLPIVVGIDKQKLQEHLSIIANEVVIEPVYPSVKLINGEVFVEKGSPGNVIDYDILNERITKALAENSVQKVDVPINTIDPSITDEQAQKLKDRANKLIRKKVKLTLGFEEFTLEEEGLFSYLNPEGGYLKNPSILNEISLFFNTEAQNPVFVFESNRVTEFEPAKDGVKIDEKILNESVAEKIAILESTDKTVSELQVSAQTTPPEITTAEVNDLGIRELIGRGSSTFFGSISSRIHNIGLASSHFNGVIVAPGDVFSFNNVLGDVSAYTGYKQAYIIKDGRTVLGDGGGVCQVSTTLFRAILDAGLPVVERRAHSYRVSYYEQGYPPGIDATVYAPTTDLKFKNDTPSHLLIQTFFNPTASSLVFEIYGTSDGRVATSSKPIVYGTTPPPEDLYQDDPTLPEGTIKQVDYKSWGANVSFSYEVERNGETIFKKDFVSNYRPWQAVFLHGTGPIN